MAAPPLFQRWVRCSYDTFYRRVEEGSNSKENLQWEGRSKLNKRAMEKKRVIIGFHILGYLLIAIFITIGFVKAAEGQEAFMEYLREDGLVENLTVLFLVAGAGIAIWRGLKSWKEGRKMVTVTWLVLAFLFLFAAGEEISWGQRIFNIETPDFFMEKNLQKETNLHNLVIGGVKVNKLIFSQLVMVVLVFYFLLLRPLTARVGFIRRIVVFTGLPLPRWGQVIPQVIGTILASQYKLLKAGEMHEFVFSVVFFLIFLYPFLPEPAGRKRARVAD